MFVFGIDGATFDIIEPAIAAGKLPHLKSLIEGGSRARLESTIHPITPMAWTSFATGCNAGQHGIFDFSRMSETDVQLNSSLNRKAPAIWTFLSQADKKCVVVNVPFTYPPEKVNGVMVPGFDAPQVNREIFHPESVHDDIMQQFGEYRLDWTFPVGQKLDVDGYLKHCRDTVKHRGETALYLFEKHPWDFYMTMFSTPDHVSHVFWKYPGGREYIQQIYELVDEQLGMFLSKLPEDAHVVIMSDHGFGPIDSIVYLDNWLEQSDYLTKRNFSLRGSALTWAKRAIKRSLPVALRKKLRANLKSLKGRVDAAEYSDAVDWSRTRAYSYGMYGNIYINLASRSARGIVRDEQYEPLCDEITAGLMALRDPETGEAVVDRVYRKEELYSGECTKDAPDLVVRWRDYAYFTKRGIDQGDAIFAKDLKVDSSEFPHTGTHRLDGVFIAKGPGIRENHQVDAKIIDLAPTIMHLMGQPIPASMDGKLVREIFVEAPQEEVTQGDVAATGQMKGLVELNEEDQESVRKRLQSLGYIE